MSQTRAPLTVNRSADAQGSAGSRPHLTQPSHLRSFFAAACRQVVGADGLDAICRTLTLDFARNSNILRNVLGLLSNISEVSPLRGALMSNGLVEHLLQILELSQAS